MEFMLHSLLALKELRLLKSVLPAFSVENSHDTPLSSVCSNHHRDNNDHDLHNTSRKRRGKGCHLLPLVKKLLESKENWKVIVDKENYQFLGTFLFPTQNILWYVEDITKLPHYTASNPDFLWSDVQFSKNSSTKQLIEVKNDKGVQKLWFHKAQCKGVKKCEQCDHTVCNSTIRNTCREHSNFPLVQVSDCDVEFVYLKPEDANDNQRWIGDLLRKHSFPAAKNFHSHGKLPHTEFPRKYVRKLHQQSLQIHH